jgi:hypothetical protein
MSLASTRHCIQIGNNDTQRPAPSCPWHRTPLHACYSCGSFPRMLQRFGISSRYVAVAYCRVLVVFGLLALCTGSSIMSGCHNNFVTQVSPSYLPSTAQSLVAVFANFGSISDVSGRVRIGGTSCAATLWRSNTGMLCRASNGAAHTRDTTFPVTATVQLQRSPSGTNWAWMPKCRYIRVSTTLAHNQGNGKDGVTEGECIAFSRLFCYDTSGAFPRFWRELSAARPLPQTSWLQERTFALIRQRLP